MGLLKNVKLNNGIELDSVYFRIGYIRGDQKTIEFSLVSYLSRDAYIDGKENIDSVFYKIEPNVEDNASNLFRQAYAYLKSVDDYKDAEDVLEEGQTPIE